MPADPDQVRMGANLTPYGATFRTWAPAATTVSVRGGFNNWTDYPLARQPDGYWFADVPGVKEGDQYKFFVSGLGSTGYKRDPYARSLTIDPPFPTSNCFVTRPETFPWHDHGFRPKPFNELVLYQLHVGAFWCRDMQGHDRRREKPGRFLDVLFKVEYLADLGINAVQLLPIQEFTGPRSLGYNGIDLYSPEMDYTVQPTEPDFQQYLDKANQLLANRGLAPFKHTELEGQTTQLMALVDLFHVYGISVIFDVVYNHAGGDFGSEGIYFYDREPEGDDNRSLYFTDKGWAGGLVFAYWKPEVRQFLIDNAKFFFDEYHVDGFRFDEVTVIDKFGGWGFLQDLTDSLRYRKPEAILIAEYWGDQRSVLRSHHDGGAGFDAVVASSLRQSIRGALAQAAVGKDAPLNLDSVAADLNPPYGESWRSVQHLENQDVVRIDNHTDRQPRIAALADSSNARSWYARSRSRVANGLLLTAPGTPMLFMGQEFMEDKYWSDSPNYFADSLIWWDGLDSDQAMRDHVRFIRELVRVRRNHDALRGDRINVYHTRNDNRVLAFHRWVEGVGNDVVIVVSLREETWWSYELGFPRTGDWAEIFNSDVYDGWVNPIAAGNGGRITASGPPRDGFQSSATIVVPANSILIFTVVASTPISTSSPPST
jgi:1,4-alpha-glucan branching enzyme